MIERLMVRHGHPRHMIVALVTMMWTSYWMWFHQWKLAIVVALIGVVAARVATIGMQEEKFGQTLWGRMLLLHLHPFNVLSQTAGFGLLLYGFWEHSAIYLLAGASVVLIGHICGWHKVDAAL